MIEIDFELSINLPWHVAYLPEILLPAPCK